MTTRNITHMSEADLQSILASVSISRVGEFWDDPLILLSETAIATPRVRLVKGTIQPVNTSSSAITLDPPASPSKGDSFAVLCSRWTAGTNNITIDFDGSGQKVDNASQDYVISNNGYLVRFIYISDSYGWKSFVDQTSEKRFQMSGAVKSHTGNTNVTTLDTVTIPGGLVGSNGSIYVASFWTTGGVDLAVNETVSINVDGDDMSSATILSNSGTTGRHGTTQKHLFAENSTSQLRTMDVSESLDTVAQRATDWEVITVNTTANFDIDFNIQLGDAGDTVYLSHWYVRVLPS